MKKPIYDDHFHKIARLRQRKYETEIRKIMNELGVPYTKAREIRLRCKRKEAKKAFKRELKEAEKLS